LLFQKIQKAFDQQAFDQANAQQRLESLEAELAARRPTKKKKVETSPNSKFANIWDIKAAQLQAQMDENRPIRIAVPENLPADVVGTVVGNMGGENGGEREGLIP
jgi:hypothetical protein